MSATLIIFITTAVFIVAVRLKTPLGFAFLGSGILLGLLSGLPVLQILKTSGASLISRDTLRLVAIVYFLTLIGILLGELGWLSRTVKALQRLIPNKKISAVLPASLIGFLPMPGGAMLSAPLVEEGLKSFDISRERLTFLNFWFRHLWEYSWPLYPGIILSTVLLGLPAKTLIASMWPLSIIAIIPGFLFGFRGVKAKDGHRDNEMGFFKALGEFVLTTWYIWFVIIFVLGFKIGILPIVAIATMITLLILRQNDRSRLGHMKAAFSWKVVVLLGGVMIFKDILASTGSVEALASELSAIPDELLLFAIPFSIGLITGVNSAFAGLGFPILLPFFLKGGFDAGNFAFAYASGFLGVLASPVHLCLVLTKHYFGATWGGIYRYIAPSIAFMLAASIILLIVE